MTPEAAAPRTSAPRTSPPADRVTVLPQPHVTLVEGSSFVVCDHSGSIDSSRSDGLFVRDARAISRWRMLVNGRVPEPLSVIPREPYACRFVGRASGSSPLPEPTLLVEVERLVGQGMRDDVKVTNHGMEPAGVDVSVEVDADFADLFHVKEHRGDVSGEITRTHRESSVKFSLEGDAERRTVRVVAPGAQADRNSLTFRTVIGPGETWDATFEVLTSEGRTPPSSEFPIGAPAESAAPAQRLREWHADFPRVAVHNDSLSQALARSERDLGVLRIIDPDHPQDTAVAAGAPWFMALFGRDSLLTSWMLAPFAPDLAIGTLRTLARLQGTKVDDLSEEQPGRILHEVRLGTDPSAAMGGASVYYGTIDATELFVMLAGEVWRWGTDRDAITALRPNIERAIDWIVEYGDRDGDGFLEYARSSDRGLLNQGWKDSTDAISFRSGAAAQGPIALAEVQGYTYAAFESYALLLEAWGEADAATSWRQRAASLKKSFHDAFWIPDREMYAMALDGSKEPVDALASNFGHCLWTGIVADEAVPALAEHLTSPEMFSGYGVRTLATDNRRFNPASYHNGSVWPHDSVLAAAGLARYGKLEHAGVIVRGLIDAADAFGGRLPELFCGLPRGSTHVPVPYPTSCSPQAWAAAVPFEILRTTLGLDVDAETGHLRAEQARFGLGPISITGLQVGGREVSVGDRAGSRQ